MNADSPGGPVERIVRLPPAKLRLTDDDLRALNMARSDRKEPKLHKCDTCGICEPWGDSWMWYGSVMDSDAGCVAKFCSQECRKPEAEAARIIASKRKARCAT